MRVIAGTKIRAIENYESKKEKWLLQVASDPAIRAKALRVAIGIGLHMNRKQRLLAWPGFNRLANILGMDRRAVIRGVKQLEALRHMRVVRPRTGSKNHPNHYHPNIWRTEVVSERPLGSGQFDTRVVSNRPPEPMNEPMKEPTIRRISEEYKMGGRGSGGSVNSIGQPKPPQSTPMVEEIAGAAEANPLTVDYAAALGSFRAPIGRFDKR